MKADDRRRGIPWTRLSFGKALLDGDKLDQRLCLGELGGIPGCLGKIVAEWSWTVRTTPTRMN